MIEGGVAGSVDIETRHPLDFKQGLSGYVNAGAEYSDLPAKVDPEAQLMVNWNNGSFGVLALGFYSKQELRRDAQEELGYAAVDPATAAAWRAANPSLPNAAGALYPTLLGQTLFQQTQTKEGGLLDIQAKPSDALSIDLTAFYSYMKAGNENRNYMFWGSHIVGPSYVPSALTVQNGTIVSGTWPTAAGAPASIVYDQILRPGTTADPAFVNLYVTFEATDNLTFDVKLGATVGTGLTTYAPAY